MQEDIQNFMDNLVRYLLFELKKRNMPVTEFNMQKLIYKIKMELGKEHELYPKLPYYWYLKGPYSEVSADHLIIQRFLMWIIWISIQIF